MVYKGDVMPDSAVSLAVIDHTIKQWWLFDPTPQLAQQWEKFGSVLCELEFGGAFITHAHAGHYPGILYFGKEALNCLKLPLYCSASMHEFLCANEPWKVLYTNKNVVPVTLQPGVPVRLSDNLEVTPIRIEHRADFTDTLCFGIKGRHKEMLFCPDIDSWNQCVHVLPAGSGSGSGRAPGGGGRHTSERSILPPMSPRGSIKAEGGGETLASPSASASPQVADTGSAGASSGAGAGGYALSPSDASACDPARNWLQEVLFLRRFDILLLDATFYDGGELGHRDMSRIPHPRVVDTLRVVRHCRDAGILMAEAEELEQTEAGKPQARDADSTGEAEELEQTEADGSILCHKCLRGSAAATVVLIHLNHSNRLWVEPGLAARQQAETGVVTGSQGMTWAL